MISSIVLRDRYTVKNNSNNKIGVNGVILSINNEIPFVRYRFDEYLDSDVQYIKKMMELFRNSTHLIEIGISQSGENDACRILGLLRDSGINIAKFIYIDITDEDIKAGVLSDWCIESLKNIQDGGFEVDRFMIKDKSTSLYTTTAKEFMRQIKDIVGNISDRDIGVCSSPLSVGEMSCLTAVRARELMSKYSESPDVALPSANHQCMNCCGCIRYLEVTSNLEAPIESSKAHRSSSTVASSKKNTSTGTTENKKPTAVKKMVVPGMFRL